MKLYGRYARALASAAMVFLCSSEMAYSASAGAKKPAGNALVASKARSSVTAVPQVATAANVLLFVDGAIGMDTFALALSNLGISPTFTNDPSSFASLLQSGSWDVVIAALQNNYGTDSYRSALDAYVAAGGKAIYTDWTGDAAEYATFGATTTGSSNFSAITAVNAGVYNAPVPINLSNPGWGIYAVGMSPTSAGVAVASYDNGDAAVIVGNDGRTIINGTLSDSYADTNAGVSIAESEINYLLGVLPASLTGTLAGTDAKSKVSCENLSSGQSVSLKAKTGFDCSAAGLAVKPGDQFKLTIKGTVK
jgi:hypothetical protein